MRLLHINHRYFPFVGGSERYIQEISEAFARQGDAVRLVTTDAFDLEYFWDRTRRRVEAPRRDTLNGVAIERVPVRRLPIGWLSSFAFRSGRRAMGELSRLPLPPGPFARFSQALPWLPELRAAMLRAGPVDLVHSTNLGLEGLAVTALDVARARDAAFVLTPFMHQGGADDRVARRYISMPHQRLLLRSADAVLVMTRMEERLAADLGADPGRIVVTGAGVSPDEVTGGDGAGFRERHGIRGRLVCSVGAMAAEKGTFDLVRAVARLRRAGHDVELALAGPMLSAFGRWYTALDERDRDGIHLLGVIDAPEKRDLLAASGLLALPSRTESFGIVYLEAWANRKPVIAADAGAVTELVRDGETGRLVPFGDSAALATAICDILHDEAAARRFGDAGYDLTVEHYTWDRVIARARRGYAVALGLPLTGECA